MGEDADQILELWTKQKYEYYVAARTLWQNNQMQMAAPMYAYAIEAQIKNALFLFPNTLILKQLKTILKINFKERCMARLKRLCPVGMAQHVIQRVIRIQKNKQTEVCLFLVIRT